MNLTYEKIFDSSVIEHLNKKNPQISELELTDKVQIDVEKIAEILDFQVKYCEGLEESGKCDPDNKIFYINSQEPIYRQRFTLAHEIGHYVLDHEGVSYRTDTLQKYDSLLKMNNETKANKFAADILMPSKLVKAVINLYMKKNNIENKDIEMQVIDDIIQFSANTLGVSTQAMRFRISNLGILSK